MSELESRLFSHVTKGPECWEWNGAKTRGYGLFRTGQKLEVAHRVSYSIARGEIPPGMYIDHICRNRSCVNPAHLRTVTHKQNMENQSSSSSINGSGFRGVSWDKANLKWRARVGHNRKTYYLGHFDDARKANDAAIAKRNELFTHNDSDRRNRS